MSLRDTDGSPHHANPGWRVIIQVMTNAYLAHAQRELAYLSSVSADELAVLLPAAYETPIAVKGAELIIARRLMRRGFLEKHPNTTTTTLVRQSKNGMIVAASLSTARVRRIVSLIRTAERNDDVEMAKSLERALWFRVLVEIAVMHSLRIAHEALRTVRRELDKRNAEK